jgi:hypothetical protein
MNSNDFTWSVLAQVVMAVVLVIALIHGWGGW